jgi:lipopolysaccharide/colanic/teichoic acid biosynthesis glycosyltransferase
MLDRIFIRAFDILISLLFIVLLLPLMVFILLLSALFIGFPPFYISKRLGKNGKLYKHLKFRSMKKGPVLGREYFEQKRINPVGRLIRKLHVDELPELFLIFSGKMSFVGPRPLEARHLKRFDTSIREQVRPGWTGLAQIKLVRKGILYGPEQIKLDGIYVRKKNFSYNLQIIGATISAVLHRRSQRNIDTNANEYRRHYLEDLKNQENDK